LDILFTKVSNTRHAVEVVRRDKTGDSAELNSRSFLRHDLAHFVIEVELPIKGGYWGSVGSGAALSGEGISGPQAMLAESLAGPAQTLMRTGGDVDAYLALLQRVCPDEATPDLAGRIHERVRQVLGLWKATPFGGDMHLRWPF
jgi:hypothetical protein